MRNNNTQINLSAAEELKTLVSESSVAENNLKTSSMQSRLDSLNMGGRTSEHSLDKNTPLNGQYSKTSSLYKEILKSKTAEYLEKKNFAAKLKLNTSTQEINNRNIYDLNNNNNIITPEMVKKSLNLHNSEIKEIHFSSLALSANKIEEERYTGFKNSVLSQGLKSNNKITLNKNLVKKTDYLKKNNINNSILTSQTQSNTEILSGKVQNNELLDTSNTNVNSVLILTEHANKIKQFISNLAALSNLNINSNTSGSGYTPNQEKVSSKMAKLISDYYNSLVDLNVNSNSLSSGLSNSNRGEYNRVEGSCTQILQGMDYWNGLTDKIFDTSNPVQKRLNMVRELYPWPPQIAIREKDSRFRKNFILVHALSSSSEFHSNSNLNSSIITSVTGNAKIQVKRINQYISSLLVLDKNLTNNFISNNSFFFNSANNTHIKMIKNLDVILKGYFLSMSMLISKPIFEFSPDKVVLYLFYYLLNKSRELIKLNNNLKFSGTRRIFKIKNKSGKLNNIKGRNRMKFVSGSNGDSKGILTKTEKKGWKKISKNKLSKRIPSIISKTAKSVLFSRRSEVNNLTNILSFIFKKPVELDLTRLYYPAFDSAILAHIMEIMINNIKYLRIKKNVIKATFIKTPRKNLGQGSLNKFHLKISPVYIIGLKVKVAGRLLTHRVIPRKTVKEFKSGILANSRVISSDTTRFLNKNKRGSYSITVTITNIKNNKV